MDLRENRVRSAAGLACLSLLFILLRTRTLGHLLMWDEAWNILSLRAHLAGAAGDPFYWYYRFHPPLYMLFAKLLLPFKQGLDIRVEMLSLSFSLGSLVSMYLLSARIGGYRYAWFSGLFLCLMPYSIGYDTWIKRDSLAIALGCLAILMLLNRKFIWCGVLLAFSLLGKETALFFVLSSVLLVFILKEKRKLSALLSILLPVTILTSWWFFSLSNFVPELSNQYFSGQPQSCPAPDTLYYVKKLLPDLGPVILIFFAAGVLHLVYLWIKKEKPEWSVPLIICLCVYAVPSLLIPLKCPWFCLSARPALAMTAGGGALYLLNISKKLKVLRYVLFAGLATAFFYAGTFSYDGYHKKTYPNGWPGAYASRELALYLNSSMEQDDRLMISEFTYWRRPFCPIFLYYWRQHPVMVLGKDQRDITALIEEIKKYDISWLVIVGSPDAGDDLSVFLEGIEKALGVKPQRVAWSYVWRL